MKKKLFAALAAAAMLCCTLAAPVSAAEEFTFQMGDVNLDGVVDQSDAILIMDDYVELLCFNAGILTPEQRQIGNVDGKVFLNTADAFPDETLDIEADVTDAMLILKYSVIMMVNPDITMEDVIGRSPQYSETLEEFAKDHRCVWDRETNQFIVVER